MFRTLIPCLALWLTLASSSPAAERPNINFILCDDLGWCDLGVYFQNERESERRHLTPHLDRFAADMPELHQRMKAAVVQLRRPNATAHPPYDDAPMPPVAERVTRPGVTVRLLAGEFPWAPVIASDATGQREQAGFTFDIPEPGAVEVSGYLKVEEEGDYTVKLAAPDAALLHIHQALVIDGDTPGKHGGTHEASVRLLPGLHPFCLGYLSGGKNAALEVTGPGAIEFVR